MPVGAPDCKWWSEQIFNIKQPIQTFVWIGCFLSHINQRFFFVITSAANETRTPPKLTRTPVTGLPSVSSFSDKKIEELGIGKEIKQVPYIMLESIDRNFRGKYNKPVYEYSDLIPINERSEDNFIILPISTDEFNSLCDASVGVNYMNINSLIKIGHKAKDFGYSNEIFVAGQKPFSDYVNHSFDVSCDDDLCIYCNDCVYTCPTDAIEEDNPTDKIKGNAL